MIDPYNNSQAILNNVENYIMKTFVLKASRVGNNFDLYHLWVHFGCPFLYTITVVLKGVKNLYHTKKS